MDFVTPFIRFLLQSEYISGNKLFLNAVKPDIGSTEIVTAQIDRDQDIEYCDGSVRHKLIFTVNDYKSISFNQLVAKMIEKNENLDGLLQAQKVVDYIIDCEKKRSYPDFGSNYEVNKIYTAYLSPSTPAVLATENPLARYSIPIIVELIDYTEAIQ